MNRIEIERSRGSKKLTVHTDFNVTRHKQVKELIEDLRGVEDVDLTSSKKYSFTVNVGKLFNTEEVMDNIRKTIQTYIDEHGDGMGPTLPHPKP